MGFSLDAHMYLAKSDKDATSTKLRPSNGL